MQKLTQRSVAALKPRQTRYREQDSELKSLFVTVRPSGSKTFYLYKQVNGERVEAKLGSFPELTVEAAREMCRERYQKLLAGEEVRESRGGQSGELILEELFHEYLERYAKKQKKSWADDEAIFRRYLTPIKRRRLSAITPRLVQERHDTVTKTAPVQANRMLALMSKMFSWASGNSIGLYKGTNPAVGIERNPEKSRERFILPHELDLFFNSLDQINETARDYILTALYTGQRSGNVKAMRWEQLDLTNAVWRIPVTKNGESQTIPLLPEVTGILERRHAAAVGPYVFPGRNHITSIKRAWEKLKRITGLDDLRIHDLRRTMGSWQAMSGVPTHTIGKTLGHKSPTATAIYARLELTSVQNAMSLAADAMRQARENSASD
jgi:integrase